MVRYGGYFFLLRGLAECDVGVLMPRWCLSYLADQRLNRCAIGCAFETRFHPGFVTFPKTLVDFFGDRARSLLEAELDFPSVATVQAMVILSSHEIGNGMDSRGWLYSGEWESNCRKHSPC